VLTGVSAPKAGRQESPGYQDRACPRPRIAHPVGQCDGVVIRIDGVGVVVPDGLRSSGPGTALVCLGDWGWKEVAS
jgi:hypothetical protein